MASVPHAQILFNDSQCPLTPDPLDATIAQATHARHQMQREKLSLQEMISEYYGLLLEAFERQVDNSPARVTRLNNLLASCQQSFGPDTPSISVPEDAATFHFWCQFQTTMTQYCQLQHRLQTFPATVGQWQIERSLPASPHS